ncbi:MAG: TIGR01906 family membrane protein [Dehalococcoidia bacterium]|nr:TIGR01906 family membrane protein [Dehalococcoidia bacterium]
MPWLSRLAGACFVLALPIMLVTTNVRFLAGDVRFYERGFRDHDAARVTGVPLPELDRSAAQIVDYFENDTSTLRIVVDRDGQETSLFNARETEHMKDVKWLMQLVFRTNEVTLAYVLAFVTAVFLWSGERPLRHLAALSLAGIGVGVLAVGVVGAFTLTGFDSTWTRFHEIVFRNDLWQLNPATDRLIQMFPESFWQDMTYLLGALTLAEALAVVIAAVSYLAFARNRAGGAVPAPSSAVASGIRPAR